MTKGDRVTVDAGIIAYAHRLDRLPGTVLHVWEDGSVTVRLDSRPLSTLGAVSDTYTTDPRGGVVLPLDDSPQFQLVEG